MADRARPRRPPRALKHGLPPAPELDAICRATIQTRCPGKWLLVDLETGEAWTPCPERQFRRAAHIEVDVRPKGAD